LASSTLIILFSEMLKFSLKFLSKNKNLWSNIKIYWGEYCWILFYFCDIQSQKIKFIGHWNAKLVILLMFTMKSRWWPKLLPKTNWIENWHLIHTCLLHLIHLFQLSVSWTQRSPGFSWNWSIIHVLHFL
jgi:hypothetical protein